MGEILLNTNVQYLKGVGPIMANRLKKLGINTVEDFLYHFPSRHDDSSKIVAINNLVAGEVQTVVGSIVGAKNLFTKRGKKIQKVIVADGTGQMEVTYFNQMYLIAQFNKAEKVSFSGRVEIYAGRQTMLAPTWEVVRSENSYELVTSNKSQVTRNKHLIHTGGLIPVYPETRGVSSKWLRAKINSLLEDFDETHLAKMEYLPIDLIAGEQLMPLGSAITQIHYPKNQDLLAMARKRLAFDEMFLLQLASQKRKYLWQKKKLSHPLAVNQEKISNFIASLPFSLTPAQNKSIREILNDLKETEPMNRLLQGDVGAGKTVVAAIAMYVAYLNGLQSALMAPTEILAQQHFKTLKAVLEPLGLNISLITGSSSKEQRARSKEQKFDVVIGTHALLHRDISDKLAVLVVDEQHRFGVEQRATLLKSEKTPHLLSMTATPIPRTVALTLYGELELSVIDEMPKGRMPVKTWVVPSKKRHDAYGWIGEQILKDRVQVFVVCPLIDESQADGMSKVKSVEKEYEYLKKEIFPKLKLGLLHGRMKATDKNDVIDKFAHKKLDLLVSTPVIEVGIDIPNATVMMIEGAERFGLAQLHQLRGRVGRSSQQSYCLLFTSDKGFETMERLKAMETNHSGFRLAELDLQLRGPGEMYGVAQHGFSRLKLASFGDSNLIEITNKSAKNLILKDPLLKNNPALNNKLDSILESQVEPN